MRVLDGGVFDAIVNGVSVRCFSVKKRYSDYDSLDGYVVPVIYEVLFYPSDYFLSKASLDGVTEGADFRGNKVIKALTCDVTFTSN